MTDIIVSAGQTVSGLTVNAPDTLAVLAGGTAVRTTVNGAAAIDPSTGIAGDARITTTLAPGGHVVALT